MADDRVTAVVEMLTDHPDGAGWYYHDEDYPEEGTCGSFSTIDEITQHVDSCDTGWLRVTIKPQSCREYIDGACGNHAPQQREGGNDDEIPKEASSD